MLSLNTSIPLADKLCQKDCEKENAGEPLYPCHYTPNEIHQGIKNKSLLYGQFFAQRDNFLEGTVRVEGQELSVCITLKKNSKIYFIKFSSKSLLNIISIIYC